MSRAAVSVFVFGLYMAGQGAGLLVVPQVLTGLFGLPPPQDFWPRVVGIALLVFALYYLLAARAELTAFYRFTVIGRVFQFVLFLGLVFVGGSPLPLMLASAVELASGIWTYFALRSSPRT